MTARGGLRAFAVVIGLGLAGQGCGGSSGGGGFVPSGGGSPPPSQTALPLAVAGGQAGIDGNRDAATSTTRLAPKRYVVWGGEVLDGYTWTLTTGRAQPAGVQVEPLTGVISGGSSLPVGSHTVGVTFNDARGTQLSFEVPITITACDSGAGGTPCALPVLQGSTASVVQLVDCREPLEYAASLLVEGGTPPYSWSVSSGQLPPGLTLSSSRGVVRGKVLAGNAGQTFTFTAQILDSTGSAATGRNTYSIRVVP